MSDRTPIDVPPIVIDPVTDEMFVTLVEWLWDEGHLDDNEYLLDCTIEAHAEAGITVTELTTEKRGDR